MYRRTKRYRLETDEGIDWKEDMDDYAEKNFDWWLVRRVSDDTILQSF